MMAAAPNPSGDRSWLNLEDDQFFLMDGTGNPNARIFDIRKIGAVYGAGPQGPSWRPPGRHSGDERK
jgi:hypothetical protein